MVDQIGSGIVRPDVDDAKNVDGPLLGRLNAVEPRDVWPHEAHSFTPWLSDNLAQLAQELGLGALSLVGTEQRIGPFSLDILAETEDGRLIAIENQLETSDHGHLGQCITYAAGVGAFAVVWVLPRLLDEHRAALDWLNEHTDEEVHFFGVEVSVVRIGDSLPAPVFRVESRPNEWQKTARSNRPAKVRRPWTVAHQALEALPEGGWTTLSEIAALVGTSPGWVGRYFYDHRHEPATLRMFSGDGTVWKWARVVSDEEQDLDAIRAELVAFGIVLDEHDRPSSDSFFDARALEQVLSIDAAAETDFQRSSGND